MKKETYNAEETERRFQLATRLNVNYGNHFILVNDKGHGIPEADAQNAILHGLDYLAEHYPDAFPVDRHTTAHRTFYIGVSLVKNGRLYLMPSFNGNGIPSLKCEFTSIVEQAGTLKQPSLKRAKKLELRQEEVYA